LLNQSGERSRGGGGPRVEQDDGSVAVLERFCEKVSLQIVR
jgi:hypothetical protein